MSNIKNPQNNPLKNPAPVRPPGGSTAPKTVYVCSPFRPTAVSEADREAEQRSNIERALKACRILAMMGIQPLAPHLYFTRFLKDELAAERDAGMRFALSWLEQADELWVFGERVSDGMAQEIAKARELGKPMAEDDDLQWNMEILGELADLAAELLTRHGSRVRYPAVVTEPDGRQYIEEYHGGAK